MPANPLKVLKLKPTHFQFIQEVQIDAPPARVWKSLLDVGGWFKFDPSSRDRRCKLEHHVGGRFYAESDGSSALHAIVTYIEPGRLLRMAGPMGMSHLPVSSAFIFELQPRANGKRTLLRLAQRTFGYLTAGVSKDYAGGWKQLLGQLKGLAEK